MSTLEERVGDLEKDLSERGAENETLKQLLSRLQEENLRLRSLGEDGTGAVEQIPLFGLPEDSPADGLLPFDFNFSLPPAPLAEPSLSFPSPTLFQSPPPSDRSLVGSPQYDYSFLDSTLLLSPLPPAPLSTTTSDYYSYTHSDRSRSHELSPLSAASPGGAASSSGSSRRLPSTPPVLSGYRDSVVQPATLGTGFDVLSTTEGVNELDAFFSQEQAKTQAAAAVLPPVTLPDCSKPYSFDLDGLCSDLQAKATCQEAARRALASAIEEDNAIISQSLHR